MLKRDAKPNQSIPKALGYDDDALFRRLFKRSTGMTPAERRGLFGPSSVRGQIALATP